MTYREYLSTPQWAIIAKQAKKRAGQRCQLCNSAGQLDAHHRTYDRLGDESDADIVVLCRSCHARFHGKTKSAIEAWLNEIRSSWPIFYNCFAAQSERMEIDKDGSVWLFFGSDALVDLLAMHDGVEKCGRVVRVARLLQSTGVLCSVSGEGQ